MRNWLFGLVAACVAALSMDAPAQQNETRIALIIANEAYISPGLGRLPGTQRDAALMRQALERAGFQVVSHANLSRTQMRSELSAFANRLSQLGHRGVGFLYYAGHGVADGPRGQNYLVPVDAQISGVPDLPATSIALNAELDGIALAGARATIFVIDACRNTPVALRRGGRGLAPVSAVTDTLIAFSTDAGETATDDGIYARLLSEELQRPGADAASVFAQVQRRVAEATGRAQRPRYDNGLLGDPIVFVAASVPTAVATAPATTPPQVTAPPPVTGATPRPGDVFRDCPDCPEMVRIPQQSFAAGRHEVTFAQWDECVAAGGCDRALDAFWGRGDRPVINVSWDDAQAYVQWLSQRTGQHYRLLTESEWEFAARAGTTTNYSWGDQDPVCDERAHNGANFRNCTDDRTRRVGSFQPNAFGLYDMHGNVAEWVEDCSDSSCSRRVLRGGSFLEYTHQVRSLSVRWVTANIAMGDYGFRVARTL